jgi:uncharacterized membrane-anchored protein
MRLPTRQPAVDALASTAGASGTIRMDRRTGSLLRRLRPGDIAVIDHLDLDRASAEALVSRGVVAVVNASAFVSGRYPNLGPQLLARSGVLMVDQVGSSVFTELREGARARVHDGAVVLGSTPVVSGRELGGDEVAALMDQARSGLATQLDSFTRNTSEFLRREQELLLEGVGIPETSTPMQGRPVVVVARGQDDREDLRRLRVFIREQRPVLIGVDSGADTLLAAGHRPDVVVVGADGPTPASASHDRRSTVTDQALRAAREVVLHTDRTGHGTDVARLARLGIQHRTLAAAGRSEDVALLLADVRGASLLVTVGTHSSLDELLDRQREGLAGTFLTRLRVGPRLVDARTVPQLYAGRVRPWHLVLVLLAGLLALAVAIGSTPVGAQGWDQGWDQWSGQAWSWVGDQLSDLWTRLGGLLS